MNRHWCPDQPPASVDSDWVLASIENCEDEAAFLRYSGTRSLADEERLVELERAIAHLYGLLNQHAIQPPEWAAAVRPNLLDLAQRIERLSEVDFYLYVGINADTAVLGLVDGKGGVLHRYVCRALDVPLAAVEIEDQHALISDGGTLASQQLPHWAIYIGELLQSASVRDEAEQVTADKLRQLLRCPRNSQRDRE